MLIKDFKKAVLIYRGREISYAETISLVNRFASCYRLNNGDRTAVFSENRPEWIYSYFSIWKNGGISVPIDYLAPADEVSYILNDCRPTVVFCSHKTKEVLTEAVNSLKGDYRPKILIFEELSLPKNAPR